LIYARKYGGVGVLFILNIYLIKESKQKGIGATTEGREGISGRVG